MIQQRSSPMEENFEVSPTPTENGSSYDIDLLLPHYGLDLIDKTELSVQLNACTRNYAGNFINGVYSK